MQKEARQKKTAPRSLKDIVLPRVALVLAATVIAFALHYWLHLDRGLKDQSQQEKTEARKQIPEQTAPSPPSRPDFDHAVRQGPPSESQSADAVSNPGQSFNRSDYDPSEATRQDMKAPAAKTRAPNEPPIPSEKPEYSDADPPKVLAIWFDPSESQTGTNVMVHVQASDDLSGVQSVWGKAQSPTGTAVLPFACQTSDDNGTFVGVIEIPEKAETGTWSIANLQVRDKVQNLKSYVGRDSLLQTAHFQIIGSDSDNTPPTIVEVRLEPYEVRGGEKVYLSVEAEDDKSGVARIHGSLVSPSNNARFSIACSRTGGDNIFSGQATLPKDAESGEWSLEYLRAEDEAKNTKMYYRNSYPDLLERATVRVYAESSDGQPPTLDDLAIIPAAVAYGEHLEIVVSSSDDVSGVNRVLGMLRSPSGKAHIPFYCTRQGASDTYKAEVIIKDNSEVGIWRVDYIRMVDKAGNHMIYGLQNTLVAGATFEVTGEP